ncbi:MAG: hypothetical protein PHE17_21590 [Thiothrix sp.]|uniref:hypothetical protein n=1 Tax=Thiothrix sp. TaxID=1032 RepID=UPI0026100E4C|nr:hypothetical protein [Thiothrix sp.]MDD5395623.1 hypothetical protein [Thiothrix sp.]
MNDPAKIEYHDELAPPLEQLNGWEKLTLARLHIFLDPAVNMPDVDGAVFGHKGAAS